MIMRPSISPLLGHSSIEKLIGNYKTVQSKWVLLLQEKAYRINNFPNDSFNVTEFPGGDSWARYIRQKQLTANERESQHVIMLAPTSIHCTILTGIKSTRLVASVQLSYNGSFPDMNFRLRIPATKVWDPFTRLRQAAHIRLKLLRSPDAWEG